MARVSRPAIDRFLERTEKGADCWVWQGSKSKTGYGYFGTGGHGECMFAHRWSYQQFKGPIPKGLTIDHLCRNTSCVNPDHLEAVSLRENQSRSASHWVGKSLAQTECVNGHPYSAANTYRRPDNGRRMCKLCRLAATRKFQSKSKVAKKEQSLAHSRA